MTTPLSVMNTPKVYPRAPEGEMLGQMRALAVLIIAERNRRIMAIGGAQPEGHGGSIAVMTVLSPASFDPAPVVISKAQISL